MNRNTRSCKVGHGISRPGQSWQVLVNSARENGVWMLPCPWSTRHTVHGMHGHGMSLGWHHSSVCEPVAVPGRLSRFGLVRFIHISSGQGPLKVPMPSHTPFFTYQNHLPFLIPYTYGAGRPRLKHSSAIPTSPLPLTFIFSTLIHRIPFPCFEQYSSPHLHASMP